MYPHHALMFCRPSRLIWFSIGSLATFTWMHYHKDHLNCRRTGTQIGYDGGSGHGQWYPQGPSARFDQQQRQGAANGGQRKPPPVAAEASGGFPADRDFDRLREMSRNAEETISGMSEATIDSMMGGLQRLKDRLAERRGQQLQDPQQPLAATSPTPPEQPTHPRHQV